MELSLSDIIIDTEFKALIPPLSASERRDLEANLLADGCVSPLVVWQDRNVLLDGHNRHEICQRRNIACKFHLVAQDSRDTAKAWIIRHQLGRRNLKESQRAMLAATLKEMFTAATCQRKAEGQKAGGHARQGDSSLLSNLTGSSTARDQAAAAMKVSSGLVHAAERVKATGSQKLQQAVMSGEVSVSAAAQVAKLPKDQQDQIVTGGKKEIARAAKAVRQERRGVAPTEEEVVSDGETPPPDRPLTVNRSARLRELVKNLKKLTDVPSMQYSPIAIRKCVAEIVQIVL